MLIFKPTQEKTQPYELYVSLEGARPGTKHNMKSKCGAWEIQVQVATLAKVKIDLQLFQEHFSFCTIVHLIYFWHQNIKYLNTVFPESPQYKEQPISGSASPLIPKSLWLENMYLHRSSNLGCWPCEKVHVSSSSEDEESTKIHSNRYSTASEKRENGTKLSSFQLFSKCSVNIKNLYSERGATFA